MVDEQAHRCATGVVASSKQRPMFAGAVIAAGSKHSLAAAAADEKHFTGTTAADLIASSLRNGPLKSSTTIDLSSCAHRTHSPAQHSTTGSGSSSQNSSAAATARRFTSGGPNYYGKSSHQQLAPGALNSYACYNQSIYSMCPTTTTASQQQPPTADLLGTGYQCAGSKSMHVSNADNNQQQVYHIGLPNNSQATRLVWHQPINSTANGSYLIERGQHTQNNYTSLNYSLNERSDSGSVYQTIY